MNERECHVISSKMDGITILSSSVMKSFNFIPFYDNEKRKQEKGGWVIERWVDVAETDGS